jgi:hypothetical protein
MDRSERDLALESRLRRISLAMRHASLYPGGIKSLWSLGNSSATSAPQSTTQPAAALSNRSPATILQPSIQLATGVALAQTGPEGTMILFSVDYDFVQGQPDSSGCVWGIERAQGAPGKAEVKLTAKGTLQAAMEVKWQPENGPFHSHLEDHQGHRVSESIEMLQPGT